MVFAVCPHARFLSTPPPLLCESPAQLSFIYSRPQQLIAVPSNKCINKCYGAQNEGGIDGNPSTSTKSKAALSNIEIFSWLGHFPLPFFPEQHLANTNWCTHTHSISPPRVRSRGRGLREGSESIGQTWQSVNAKAGTSVASYGLHKVAKIFVKNTLKHDEREYMIFT